VLAAFNRLGVLESVENLRKMFAAANPLFISPASPEDSMRHTLDNIWCAWLADGIISSKGAPLQHVLLRASYLLKCCSPVGEAGAPLVKALLIKVRGVDDVLNSYLDILPDLDGAQGLQEDDASVRFQVKSCMDSGCTTLHSAVE
jgi:hypothetical protein